MLHKENPLQSELYVFCNDQFYDSIHQEFWYTYMCPNS